MAVGLGIFEDLAHLCHALHRAGNVIGGILDTLGAAQEILGVVKRCSLVGPEELNHPVKVFLGIEQAVLMLGERGQERLGLVLVLKDVGHLRAHLLALVLTGIRVGRLDARVVVACYGEARLAQALKALFELGHELILVGGHGLEIKQITHELARGAQQPVAHAHAQAHLGLIGILAQECHHAAVVSLNRLTAKQHLRALLHHKLRHHICDIDLAPAKGPLLVLALDIAHSGIQVALVLNFEVVLDLLERTRVARVHASEPRLDVARQSGADIGIARDRRADIVGLFKDYIAQLRQHLLKDLGGLGRADLNHAAVDCTTCVEHSLAQKGIGLLLVIGRLAHLGLDDLARTQLKLLEISRLGVLANLGGADERLPIIRLVTQGHDGFARRSQGQLGIVRTAQVARHSRHVKLHAAHAGTVD